MPCSPRPNSAAWPKGSRPTPDRPHRRPGAGGVPTLASRLRLIKCIPPLTQPPDLPMTLPASRPLFLFAFFVCVLLLATAYYMEYVMELLPCPLCLVQRAAFLLISLTCLAAVLHNPLPRPG